MNNFDFNLQSYLKCPLSLKLSFPKISAKLCKKMQKLAFGWFDITLNRWYHIKEIRNVLIEDKILNEFSINLTKSLKTQAYMKDGDGIYFSLGALLFKSNMTTFKVLCHELAHTWLSNQSFYKELKILNKEFKKAYKNNENVYLASPIELYAMVVSVSLMEMVKNSLTKSKQIKRINKYIELECAKIKELTDLIQTL